MNTPPASAAHPSGWARTPLSGAGIGLRSTHVSEILETHPDVAWFEILTENHIAHGGLIPAQLSAIRAQYPLTFHCVGMSLAGTSPLDFDYLRVLKRMMRDFEPAWVSDHLCFTQSGGHHYHDLLPVPYTQESLRHVSERVRQVQDFLGERILVENVSSYLEFAESDLTEAEFIAALLETADCDLLLDINNVYVNASNHGFSTHRYLESLPLERVREIHLAGYEDRHDYLLDAHNNPVSPPVWDLYKSFVQRRNDIPVLIEWDKDIPEFSVLQREAELATIIINKARTGQAA